MAGGIFGDRPFALNPKCIVFALICMALFLYKPSISHPAVGFFVLGTIFTVAYVAMAWYDYYFNCDIAPLRKGTLSLQGTIKPPAHQPDKQFAPMNKSQGPVDSRRDQYLIYLLHILIIAPFIGFIAYMGKRTPASAFWLLGAVAVMTLFYHSLAAYAGM